MLTVARVRARPSAETAATRAPACGTGPEQGLLRRGRIPRRRGTFGRTVHRAFCTIQNSSGGRFYKVFKMSPSSSSLSARHDTFHKEPHSRSAAPQARGCLVSDGYHGEVVDDIATRHNAG
ncbi:hypothetical protein GCM10017786_13680 [Amycolatopsis deserti]|uniref:Uncharacterized protein n=1 Tax=Amycolatopsis deserti TaxID=185696 RepID=A0ABQ3IKB0_9PSEU|nr:hypothetical protein GCM10017786_13680 [Amycolatopsis deserti]